MSQKKTQNRNWIFFDLDNTLISWDEIYAVFFKRAGFTVAEKKLFERARSLVKSELPKFSPTARNRLLYLKTFLDLKQGLSPVEALRFAALYEKVVSEEGRKQVLRLRRHALFATLRKRYQLGIVSNENLRTQLFKMKALDPHGKFFDFLLTSEESGVEKPDPKIFRRALRLAGTRASRVIFVGDNVKFDIVPAHRLGMTAIFTSEFVRPEKLPRGIQSIARLDDLKSLL